MKDLKQLIVEQLEKSLTEERIKPLVEESIDKLIQSLIASELSSYSNFGTAVKDIVKSQMHVNLNDLDLASYNAVIASAIKGHAQKVVSSAMTDEIIKGIDEIFGEPPAEITLNDLCQKLLEGYWSDEWECEQLDVTLSENEYPLSGYSLSVRETGDWASRKSLFDLYIPDGHIRINHRMAYNPTCMNKMELFIFKCYANRTKITKIDEFDDEAEWFYNPNLD